MTNSLTLRSLKGAGWTGSSAVFSRVIGFGRAIILARLLIADDFGVFSMALTIVAALEALTKIGLDHSVIASRYSSSREYNAHLDTAWTIELIKRIAFAGILIAAAPHAVRFYHTDQLGEVLPVFGALLVLQGFQNVGLVALRKQLNFKRIVWHEVATFATAATASVLFALFVRRDVWAMVWGELIGVGAGVVVSYVVYPRLPRLSLERSALGRIFRFGRYAFIIGVTAFITTTLDNVVVGRMLGVGALGEYAVAYGLVSLSSIAIVDVINKVTLPAYGQLNTKRPERIAAAFADVFAAAATILAVVTAVLWVAGDEFVVAVYGEKWAAARQVLKVIAVLGFARGLMLVVSSVLLGMDHPRLVARGKLLEATLFAVLLYPLILSMGLAGAAWTGVIVYSLALVLRLHMLGWVVPEAPRKARRILFRAIFCALSGVAAGSLSAAPFESQDLRLIVGALAAAAAALLVAWQVMPRPRGEVGRFFRFHGMPTPPSESYEPTPRA